MADSNSNNLANDVINKINNAKRVLRSTATSLRSSLSEIDSIIANPTKKAILVNGLTGMDIDANDLKDEKDALQAINQYILDNVPELTS